MMGNERFEKYLEIAKRAEKQGWKGDKLSLLMSIEEADKKFNLRLDDWLKADDFNFFHDIYGILENVKRESFGFFLPRFSGK